YYSGVGRYRVWNGGARTDVYYPTSNTWYRHKIVFHLDTITFDWYIYSGDGAGTLLASLIGALPHRSWVTDIDKFYLSNVDGGTDIQRFDAIGYSWDPDYNIGDNAGFPTTPLADDYPATYSFDDDIDWETPSGWTGYNDASCWTDVYPNIDGYNKVVWLYDGATPYDDQARMDTYFEPRMNGTIEWWWQTWDNSKSIQFLIVGAGGLINILAGYYVPGQISPGSVNYNANEWIHTKVIFNVSSPKWELWINEEYVGKYNYQLDVPGVNPTYLSGMIILTGNAASMYDYSTFVDAIGFSWDPNYNVGDNLHPSHYTATQDFEQYYVSVLGDYPGTHTFTDHTIQSGLFYGSYDFRYENVGAGYPITGWGGGSYAEIIEEWYGHKYVMKRTGGSYTSNFFAEQQSGTIEFWWYTPHDLSDPNHFVRFENPSVGTIGEFYIQNGNLYWDSSSVTPVLVYSNFINYWHHVRLDFNGNNVGIYIDGGSYVASTFNTGTSGLNRIVLSKSTSVPYYFDAFGYSWDDSSHDGIGYGVGWNRAINAYGQVTRPPNFPLTTRPLTLFNDLAPNNFEMRTYGYHNDVINVRDLRVTSGTDLRDYLGNRTTGTVEFWIRPESSDQPINIWLNDGDGTYVDSVYLYLGGDGNIYRWDSTYGSTFVQSFPGGKWYHFREEFNTTAGTFNLWIDGVQKVTDGLIGSGNVDAINYLWIDTGSPGDPAWLGRYMIDAIGYDWDPNYNVGDNANPTDLSALENDGWTFEKSPYTSAYIVDDGIRHNKVLKLEDDSLTQKIGVTNDFESGQINGTIEFWAKASNVGRESFYKITNQAGADSIVIRFEGSTFRYYNGSTLIIDQKISANTWYHIVIVFNCVTDTFDLYLNGILVESDINFRYTATTLDSFYVCTKTNKNNYDVFLDAISYSWEGEYIPTGIAGVISNITLNTNGQLNPVLYYSLKTTQSTPVFVKIYNFNTGLWETIDYGIFSNFDENKFPISSAYLDSTTNDVKCRIVSYSGTSIYSLYLEQFKIKATRTSNPVGSTASITKLITNSFINRYDSNPNYEELYTINVEFDYRYNVIDEDFSKSAEFILENNPFTLITDGSWRSISETFEFDSTSRDSFEVIFNISNGVLDIDNMVYSYEFKSIDINGNILLQQDFEIGFPEEDELLQYRNFRNIDYIIYNSYDLILGPDGSTYYNTYGRTDKLEIIYKVKANGQWYNPSSIYSTSVPGLGLSWFNVSQFMDDNYLTIFEDFAVEYVLIGNQSNLVVNWVSLN
ncbi:hypothetical protein LCGC14_1492700, partial [marine sediment metagenome]